MIKLTHTASLFILGSFVTACTTPVAEPPANFGAAVNHNIEAQIANPEHLATNEPVVSDGARVQRAQVMYKEGKTTKVEKVDTQSSSGK